MLSIPPTTEPAAYLARWPVIFEGSVTGLPSPRHEVPVFRLRAIHFALMTRFIDSYRAADRDGREPEGRVVA